MTEEERLTTLLDRLEEILESEIPDAADPDHSEWMYWARHKIREYGLVHAPTPDHADAVDSMLSFFTLEAMARCTQIAVEERDWDEFVEAGVVDVDREDRWEV